MLFLVLFCGMLRDIGGNDGEARRGTARRGDTAAVRRQNSCRLLARDTHNHSIFFAIKAK
jgi:hypothetical protein